MTHQEKLIVSAYAGILMTDIAGFHGFVEEKLGRPVFLHELGNKELYDELKALVSADFVRLCNE